VFVVQGFEVLGELEGGIDLDKMVSAIVCEELVHESTHLLELD
jgi:hypothetical protein